MSDGLVDDDFPVAIASSERIFEGHVWDVRKDVFEYGGETISRDYVDHTGAVAILAMDDDDRVLLIKQYRHPIRKRDWEIPAGLLDVAEESLLAAAQRELAEEVDLVAAEWRLLVDIDTSPGGSNEFVTIYLARGLSAADAVFERTQEEVDIEKRWVPLDTAVEAFLRRDLANVILGVAVLAAQAGRANGWKDLGPATAASPRHPGRHGSD